MDKQLFIMISAPPSLVKNCLGHNYISLALGQKAGEVIFLAAFLLELERYIYLPLFSLAILKEA